MSNKIVDPVDDGKVELEEVVDISKLTLEDFQPVPQSAATQVDPFEGYPLGKDKDIKIGEKKDKGQTVPVTTKTTFIVGLAPSFYVAQDPSGLNQTINKKVGPGKFIETVVDIKTSHNRCVVNSNGQNEDVVFDKILDTGNGKLRYAIVPDHKVRSQLIYRINARKEGRPIEVDPRYLLLDIKQKERLRKVFASVYYQQTKTEKAAMRHYEAKGDE